LGIKNLIQYFGGDTYTGKVSAITLEGKDGPDRNRKNALSESELG
jgi:hypothetical protein